jgi:hypothetical protein
MHILRRDLANLHNLIRFHQRYLRILAHTLVEIILCFPELAIPHPIRFVDFHEGVVAKDGFFHHIGFAIELPSFFRLGHHGDGAVFVVPYGELARLD